MFAIDRERSCVLIGDAIERRSVQLAPGRAISDVLEGDLVEIDCEFSGESTQLVARSVTVVARPSRDPFSRASETAHFAQRGVAKNLVERAKILARIRAWFEGQRYIELETPSVAVCPGLDLHLLAYEARDASTLERLGFLVTSPEYHMKRAVVGGLSRCFQFARCFRAGESGSRHEPEFTMLEWYRAWGTLDDLLADTEAIVRAACGATVQGTDGPVVLDQGFERLTVRQAFARWAPEVSDPIALAHSDEHEYFRWLGERIEPELGRSRPTFLTHFAARHASLSKLDPSDPTVCLRAELYVDGMELSNGFVELTDAREQRTRFQRDVADRLERGMAAYPIDEDFLSALDEGMPPCVGNAMGIDRLVAVALGTRDLAEVIAFSRRRA
ncbi:MAG: amino acid--tRNA ligase-related protein [Polyangiales bacterium]